MVKHAYIGDWNHFNSGRETYWRAPHFADANSTIKLANRSQNDLAGLSSGQGVFCYSRAIVDAALLSLGDVDENPSLSARLKADIVNLLGLGEVIIADSLIDVIWEIMTKHGDDTQVDRWGNLSPNSRGITELYLGGELVKAERVRDGSPLWGSTLRTLHQQYREMRAFGNDDHRRALTSWMRRFNEADFTKFIPDDLPQDERPRSIDTSHVDNFNRADSDTLGTASGGLFAWVEDIGDADIDANTLLFPSNNNASIARSDTALGEGNMGVTIELTGHDQDADCGPICRHPVSTTQNFYHWRLSGTVGQLYEVSGGSFTQLGSDVTGLGDAVWKIEANGTTIKGFTPASTERISVTDATHSDTSKGHGLRSFDRTRCDDYDATDIVSGVSVAVLRRRYEGY